MNSFAVRLIFGAALVATPLLSAATLANRATTHPDVTLLTGPNLLSPASRPLAVESISSELVAPARIHSAEDVERARMKLAPSRDQLTHLRLDRRAALKSKKESSAPSDFTFRPATTPLAADPIRFDMAIPALPMDLLHSSPPPKSPSIKRE